MRDVDCATTYGSRVRGPNVAFCWAAGDLADGGSTADPSLGLALSESGGRATAFAPDAAACRGARKGAGESRPDPPKLSRYARVNIVSP